MMGEAVEERAGKPLRAEDGGPFIEWQVAGDECGAAFIALTEDLEEQLRADSRERHITQFVDDQKFDCIEMFLQRPQAPFVACFHEFVHESGGGGEGDAVTLLASGQPQCQSGVGFAGARWSERNAVMALLDPFAARQFQNERFVERRLGGEVEGVEAFGLRKTRQPDTALDVAPVSVDAL